MLNNIQSPGPGVPKLMRFLCSECQIGSLTTLSFNAPDPKQGWPAKHCSRCKKMYNYIYMCVCNSLFNLKAIFGIFTPYEPSFTVRSLQFIQIPSLVVQPGAQQKQLQVDLHQASQTPSKMAVTSHHWLLVGTPTPLKKLMEWKSIGMMTFPIWWEKMGKVINFILPPTRL